MCRKRTARVTRRVQINQRVTPGSTSKPRMLAPMGVVVSVLASGSRGNSAVVQTSKTKILVDAGISCRETFRRMKALRFHLIALPGRVVRHARQLIIRVGASAQTLAMIVEARRTIQALASGPAG